MRVISQLTILLRETKSLTIYLKRLSNMLLILLEIISFRLSLLVIYLAVLSKLSKARSTMLLLVLILEPKAALILLRQLTQMVIIS